LVYELAPNLVYDDYLDGFYLQGGTQWDGFLHVRDPTSGAFYNGRRDLSVGIEAWARRGIAGRGVLLDLARWAIDEGEPIDWRSERAIRAEDLAACAAAQGVDVTEGTVLLLRFGWQEGYAKLSPEERMEAALAPRPSRFPPGPGLMASSEVAELLWEWGVAALACDNQGVEVFPMDVNDNLHTLLLPRLGIPLGEFFLLDELAACCVREGRSEFFFTSSPLNLAGGVGSPANALAIM
jgi:hypothetical protein